MRHLIRAMAVCALLGAVPGAMSAEPAALTINKACGPDLAKFCSHVKPGSGDIAQCIRENVDRLSPACKEAVKNAPAIKK